MSSRRQRSIQLGGRYRQVSLYFETGEEVIWTAVDPIRTLSIFEIILLHISRFKNAKPTIEETLGC